MDNTQLTPALLEQELKKKIIGQDVYLHDLSTCIWLHNERRQYFLRTGKKISRPKYNLFVLGKSGMGKARNYGLLLYELDYEQCDFDDESIS